MAASHRTSTACSACARAVCVSHALHMHMHTHTHTHTHTHPNLHTHTHVHMHAHLQQRVEVVDRHTAERRRGQQVLVVAPRRALACAEAFAYVAAPEEADRRRQQPVDPRHLGVGQ